MKKIYTIACLLLLSMTISAQGIKFEQARLAEVLKKAELENKIVFIDCYAVWCGPCRKMAKTTFKDAKVGEHFDKYFLGLKIDVERGEGPNIKQKYDVSGLPGYLFLDHKGNVVYRSSGYMAVDKFMKEIKLAQKYASDPNSVGRLAARYEKEKNNEVFMKLYLDKLKESNSKGYFEEFEQYLKVQKTIMPESSEMALLIVEHKDAIVFGGLADKYIDKYFYSDGWKKVVRKDVRAIYQVLPKKMAEHTLEYAVKAHNIDLIDVSLKCAKEKGLPIAEGQKDRLLEYYYLHTGNGEEYKKMSYKNIEAFYQSMDLNAMRDNHQKFLKRMEEEPGRSGRSFAQRDSEKLLYMAIEYAKFVVTDAEKQNVLRWAKMVYDIIPDRHQNISFYSNILYLFSDKNYAIELKKKAVELADTDKSRDDAKADLEDMKAGRKINL